METRENEKREVAILMATYNGERFLAEQLESLLSQTHENFALYVRDDGSSDRTMEILSEYVSRDERIHLVDPEASKMQDAEQSGWTLHGAKENFSCLYEWAEKNTTDSYYMFCDQDDVWLPDKIEDSLSAITHAEELEGEDQAILLHTDLRVVDENLKTIGESYLAYRALDPSIQDLPHLLAQNNITGCTMMWNRAFMEKVRLTHPYMYLHDWWMSLSAAALGRIVYLPKATILYRQHSGNEVGATKVNSLSYILARARDTGRIHRTIRGSMMQAEGMLEAYQGLLSEDDTKVLTTYAELLHAGKLKKLLTIRRGHYEKQGRIQKIAQRFFI